MVKVEFVDVSKRGIQFPNDRVRMVVAQPHIPRGSLTEHEPFQFTPDAKRRQLEILEETVRVAGVVGNGAKTHFAVIPEYGIPGADGVGLLEDRLRSDDWPNGTVLIGGTDGLTSEQYRELIRDETTHVDMNRNAPDLVGTEKWVNCAITWIKSADGQLERWVQPKIQPAWKEKNIIHQQMHRGGSIYAFKGSFKNGAPFLFATLVCFDWIASTAEKRVFQWLLSGINEAADDGQLPLGWIFIIQLSCFLTITTLQMLTEMTHA